MSIAFWILGCGLPSSSRVGGAAAARPAGEQKFGTCHVQVMKIRHLPMLYCVAKPRPFLRLTLSTTALFASFGPAASFAGGIGTSSHNYTPLTTRPSCFQAQTSRGLITMASASPSDDAQILESPSAERNKGPIYDHVLEPLIFPLVESANAEGRDKLKVLELAAGCGVHTTHFASSFLSAYTNEVCGLEWHPSDPDAEARASIDARVRLAQLEGSVVPANGWILGVSGGTACNDGGHRDRGGDAGIDQSGTSGDTEAYAQYHNEFDLVTCINMIHIAPWEATLGLMECAGRVLRTGGMLMCYGPYKVGGTAAESNLRFDQSLRSRNASWGVRNLEDVTEVATSHGLELVESVEMPANNLSVLFRKV